MGCSALELDKTFYEEASLKRKPRVKTESPTGETNASKDSGGKPKKPHKKKLARAAALKAKSSGVKKGQRKNTRKKDRR